MEKTPKEAESEMIIDDDVISKMADSFPEVRKELQKIDPRVNYMTVIEKILANNFIPLSKRAPYRDLIVERTVSRKSAEWAEGKGSGGLNNTQTGQDSIPNNTENLKSQVSEKKEPSDWILKYRDSGRDNY